MPAITIYTGLPNVADQLQPDPIGVGYIIDNRTPAQIQAEADLHRENNKAARKRYMLRRIVGERLVREAKEARRLARNARKKGKF